MPVASHEAGGQTIWSLLEQSIARWPDTKLVFSTSGEEHVRSFAELRADALRLAEGLRRRGLKQGDIVVVQLPHCPENLVTFLACMAAGLVFVPVVHNYGPAEIGFMLRQTGAKLLIMPARWHNFDYPARARALAEIDTLQCIAFTGEAVPAVDKALAWSSLLADQPLSDVAAVDLRSPCMIIYTSGTTSVPKGAMHCHASLIAEAEQTSCYIDMLTHKTMLQSAPAGHIGPISSILRQMIFGFDIVYLDRWETEVGVDLIRRYDIGWSIGVPIYLNAVLAAKKAGTLPSFDTFMVGGTNVPPALVEEADRAGIRASRSYGSTEHPTVTQGKPVEPLAKRARTDGSLMPGCGVRLLDDDDRDVAQGEPGEIVTSGGELFLGYFDASLNATAFTADGWYRTGDIGVMDEDGFLKVVDRKKDIIIRGGENISSKEVEDALAHHPAVLEAAAVGWPDERMGEKVGAFVRLREGAHIDMAEVQRHFKDIGMARIKTPEHLVVVDEFPRNPSGKILKTELRARARAAGA